MSEENDIKVKDIVVVKGCSFKFPMEVMSIETMEVCKCKHIEKKYASKNEPDKGYHVIEHYDIKDLEKTDLLKKEE